MQFSPCKGGDFCSAEGTHCSGCGRSHEEIAQTRDLIGAIVRQALDMGYENVEEFTAFVGQKAAKKIRSAQMMSEGTPAGIGGIQIK